jgi:GT2 family glycosyltransferase
VLVVSYNTLALAGHMLHRLAQESLTHADGRPLHWEWVLVDNASPHREAQGLRTLEAVQNQVPGRILLHDQNPGYAGGMNLALQHARGSMILVCNPDMVFEPGCVNQLVAYLQAHPQLGAVGPKGFWDEGLSVMLPPNIVPTLGDLLGVTMAALSRRWNRRYAKVRTRNAVPVWASEHPVELPMLSGCCFLMQRSLIEAMGFFDERFPLYYEDTDLFRRITRSGRKMVMLPAAKLVHFYNRSGVTSGGEALRRYWISRRRYYRKWYGLPGQWLYDLCKWLAESKLLTRRAKQMDRIDDLGAVTEAPTLVLPRSCERFVIEVAQDPAFLLAGGIVGAGDRWTPAPRFWQMLDDSTFYFRATDSSHGRLEHLGTWSFARRHQDVGEPLSRADRVPAP